MRRQQVTTDGFISLRPFLQMSGLWIQPATCGCESERQQHHWFLWNTKASCSAATPALSILKHQWLKVPWEQEIRFFVPLESSQVFCIRVFQCRTGFGMQQDSLLFHSVYWQDSGFTRFSGVVPPVFITMQCSRNIGFLMSLFSLAGDVWSPGHWGWTVWPKCHTQI